MSGQHASAGGIASKDLLAELLIRLDGRTDLPHDSGDPEKFTDGSGTATKGP